ncbi:MAG: DNA methyltransferase [bacterium]
MRPQTTTLWEYPSQQYGVGGQGSTAYRGATPAYVIWNLLERYTRPGDVIMDPFCGSGTTLDVARDLGRTGIGFDVHPTRPDIQHADARRLPQASESVDFVFADPPYGDNLNYGDDPRCIGQLPATDEAYFEALDGAFKECFRVLKNRRFMGLYICDFYDKRRGFVPIGTRSLALLMQYFNPIDHIAVVRHNRTLKQSNRHRAAEEGGFYLRGFNHLFIVKKQTD